MIPAPALGQTWLLNGAALEVIEVTPDGEVALQEVHSHVFEPWSHEVRAGKEKKTVVTAVPKGIMHNAQTSHGVKRVPALEYLGEGSWGAHAKWSVWKRMDLLVTCPDCGFKRARPQWCPNCGRVN